MPIVNLARFNTPNFRQRVMSAAILIPLVLVCVYTGGWAYAAAVTLTMLLGLHEWLRLIDPNLKNHIRLFAHAIVLMAMGFGAWQDPALGLMIAALLTLVLFIAAARDCERTAGWIAIGIPYMGGAGLALLYLRGMPEIGLGLICYLFATVWGTDIGAYLVGKVVGGPKLAPDISPNKTWAGLGGGMILAAGLGYAVAVGFGMAEPVIALVFGCVLAGVSQAGDLFKSYFKRRAGVKESGDLIPGHGGVLDRIDGLVFAAIFMVFFEVALDKALRWWPNLPT